MSAVGRNDPCPCGSGKKFKRCCGAARVNRSKAGYTEAERESAIGALARFARRAEFEQDLAVGRTLFWPPSEEMVEGRVGEYSSRPMVLINEHNFLTLDVEIKDGKTLIDLFLERRAPSLSQGERSFLEDLRRTHVGLYEVLDSRPRTGLHLRDLWVSDQEYWVEEHAGSSQLCRSDVLAARISRRPSGTHVLEGDIYPFPARMKARILGQLEADKLAAEGCRPPLSPEAFLKRVTFRFHHLWLQSLDPSPPELATSDESALEPTVMRYDVQNPIALVRALDACAELEQDEEVGWVFFRENGDLQQYVGSLQIEGAELVATTLFRSHAEQMRALIERLAGEAVRHTATQERSVQVDQREWLGGAENRGQPAPIYPELHARLDHYLDDGALSDRIPETARRMGLYLGRITASASQLPDDGDFSVAVDCRRRPANRPCHGQLRVRREENVERFAWRCPSCGDGGTIDGWRDTPFDVAARLKRQFTPRYPGGTIERIAVPITDEEHRRLLRLGHLEGAALGLLLSAKPHPVGMLLEGNEGDFASLAHCILIQFGCVRMSRRAADELAEMHGVSSTAAGEVPDRSRAAIGAELLIRQESRRPRVESFSGDTGSKEGLCVDVRLLHIEPPIHRRLELPASITLADLHHVLVLAMGWADTHLHVFRHDRRSFAPPGSLEEMKAENSLTTRLGDLLRRVGDTLSWEYDFGDSWCHQLRLVSVLPKAPKRARLTAGDRACPPEDCGGPPGYECLLASLADPFDPEHEDNHTWVGASFNAEFFDPALHDGRLERLASGWDARETARKA